MNLSASFDASGANVDQGRAVAERIVARTVEAIGKAVAHR